jgi:hypothetical protein
MMKTNRRLWQSSALAVVSLMVAESVSSAADFFTTNSTALTHFWAAAESSNRPVTVVSFGDSMADSYQGVSYHLMKKLRARLGAAGYSLNTYENTALWRTTNGAQEHLEGGSLWFSLHYSIPAGAALWWDNQPTPGGVYCDSAGLFFISQTNGGQFRLSVSTNGGPWTPALILEGYSPTPIGHFTNLALPPNRYRLRVDGDSGTNYVIGTSLVLSRTGGVHAVFLSQPGLPLYAVTNIPTAVREPIFAGLKPDLLIWHMKEPIGPLPSCLAECERWWSNAAPNCDVVYIGTTWMGTDAAGGTDTVDQNTIVRAAALQYHRVYADLMQPTVSYAWLVSQGFIMADGVHLNSAGGLYCANLMWDDLGFFALGLNRQLSLASSGTEVQLSYHTDSRARYRLETSADLHDWLPVLTNAPGSAVFSTNFTHAPGPAFYRLGLSPN